MRFFGKSKTFSCSHARRELSAYMDRRLSSEREAALKEHISTCLECQKDLAALEATVALLHRLPQATPLRSIAMPAPGPIRARRAVVSFGMATAVVSLLLVLAFTADVTNFFQTTHYVQEDTDNGIAGSSQLGSSYTEETTRVSAESEWVRPLEFGLIGATIVLGGVTYLVWRRSRRPAAVPTRR